MPVPPVTKVLSVRRFVGLVINIPLVRVRVPVVPATFPTERGYPNEILLNVEIVSVPVTVLTPEMDSISSPGVIVVGVAG